jgi:hypothetical protein
LGRSDCCQERNYGNKVYADDTLCGVWPSGGKNDWVEFKCPAGTKAKKIKVVQEKRTALTLCGLEVYGHYTDIDNQLDAIDYAEVKLPIRWAKDSGVDRRWPWHARKLVASQGTPQPNIRKSDT